MEGAAQLEDNDNSLPRYDLVGNQLGRRGSGQKTELSQEFRTRPSIELIPRR